MGFREWGFARKLRGFTNEVGKGAMTQPAFINGWVEAIQAISEGFSLYIISERSIMQHKGLGIVNPMARHKAP